MQYTIFYVRKKRKQQQQQNIYISAHLCKKKTIGWVSGTEWNGW